MKRFLFWQRWLFITSILFALFGVVFALYGDNPLFHPYTVQLSRIFFGTDEFPANIEPFRAFVYGPAGACIACCYILLAFITWYPFRRKEKWAWWSVVVAFGAWATLDSAVSLYYGVYFQPLLINMFSILVKALPLVMTWGDFFGPSRLEKPHPGPPRR
jgi:hypothetical protein